MCKVSVWLWVGERVSEWMSEWVIEWVSEIDLIFRTHLAVTKHFNVHAQVWARGCNNAQDGAECVVQPSAHTSAPMHLNA